MMRLLLVTAMVPLLASAASNIYDFTMKSIDGKPAPISAYQGKVVLVVNVASQCGYTPQYAGLEKLYETYKSRGFVIVGVPANNFGGQEPGSDAEIQQFCSRKYSVTFPMMSKVSVKGSDQTPLFQWLTDPAANPKSSGDVKWNFTKFLINRGGQVVSRFDSAVEPGSAEITSAVEKALSR